MNTNILCLLDRLPVYVKWVVTIWKWKYLLVLTVELLTATFNHYKSICPQLVYTVNRSIDFLDYRNNARCQFKFI